MTLGNAGPNRRLGKYRLLRRLGAGGMGVVHEAEDTTLHRLVAIKLLSDAVVHAPTALARFQREARAVAKLNHPNIVTIHEIGQEHATHYLVMELLAGGSVLEPLTLRGPYPWREATRIVADACRGLVAAHQAGLIHRDVKPGNLLRTRDGVAKLGDFGLVKSVQSDSVALTHLSQGPAALGTPAYMSPEQCRSEPLDERSDLYSLGATYYTLLTAQMPFRGESPLELMFAHCSTPCPDPRRVNAKIPAECSDFIRKAMAKEPADRHASAAAMLAELEALLEEPPLTEASTLPSGEFEKAMRMAAPTETPTAPVPARPSRGLRWLAVGAGISLLAVAAIVLVFMQGKPEDEVKKKAAMEHKVLTEAPPSAVLKVGGKVWTVAFSPDGKWLAAGVLGGANESKGTHLWTLPNLDYVGRILEGQAVRCVAFAPDSSVLAQSTGDPAFGGAVHFFDTATRGARPLLDLGGALANVRVVAFSPTARWLAAGLDPLGPTQGKRVYFRAWDWPNRQPLFESSNMNGMALSLAYSPDETTLASGSDDGRLRLASPQTGELRYTSPQGTAVRSLAYFADSKRLIVVRKKSVERWNAVDPRIDATILDDADPHGASIAPDESAVAFGNRNQIVLWDPVHERVTRQWQTPVGDRGHKPNDAEPANRGYIWAVAFSPDSTQLATASEDGTVRVWKLK